MTNRAGHRLRRHSAAHTAHGVHRVSACLRGARICQGRNVCCQAVQRPWGSLHSSRSVASANGRSQSQSATDCPGAACRTDQRQSPGRAVPGSWPVGVQRETDAPPHTRYVATERCVGPLPRRTFRPLLPSLPAYLVGRRSRAMNTRPSTERGGAGSEGRRPLPRVYRTALNTGRLPGDGAPSAQREGTTAGAVHQAHQLNCT